MKKYIVDTASKGVSQLSLHLQKQDLNILGVSISCDASDYDNLSNSILNEIRKVSTVKVYKGAQRAILDKTFADKFAVSPATTDFIFEDTHAVNFILDTVKNNDDVEIICLGPLTNIALAIMKDAATMQKVKNIYVAGGSLMGYQSTNAVAHHNILADVEAADAVFKTNVPITLIPSNISKDMYKTTFDIVNGAAYTAWQAYITVDTSLSFTRGQTVIDLVGRNPINGDITPGIKKTVVTSMKG